MAENEILVRAEDLEPFVDELFRRAGLAADDAAFSARCLVDTNLWGIDSHGVLRLPDYVKRLRKRAINPQPQSKLLRGSQGLEVIDGDDGPGFIVGRDAMLRAIELAETHNVGVVGAIRSNHFGAAALYARLAAERGMVGIAMTNVIPNVVAPGGTKPITGNNPFAIAIPTYGDFPFVLDMSLSAVAGGKLLLASKKGEKIPLDWAVDKDGRPTDDPDKAFKGFLLPMGGFKGLGLSYAVDILCGLITGGVYGDQMKSMYAHPDDPSLTGHLMIVINLAAIISPDDMKTRMAGFYARIKASPMLDPQGEMFLPGEIEYRSAQKRRAAGLPIPPKLYDELKVLGAELGVSRPLTPVAAAA
ncbi:MAG: Ldh family oxidoreductase [Anaerolineales bacterium]|nr:Ldh family oxidoreductase [Anaerolineales bacterium]